MPRDPHPQPRDLTAGDVAVILAFGIAGIGSALGAIALAELRATGPLGALIVAAGIAVSQVELWRRQRPRRTPQ